MTDVHSLVELLAWDSEFFGFRIARIKQTHLSNADISAINAWVTAEKIDCLYFLAESDDAHSVRIAEENHFALVDIRLTLDVSLKSDYPALEGAIRSAQAVDLDRIRAISSASYQNSRFYYDAHFPTEKNNQLYVIWVEKLFNHAITNPENHHIFVADQGDVAGFITCEIKNSMGEIGLFAVDSAYQGGGLGGALITAALAWFAEQGITHAQVVTQGRSIIAQRAYQRAGFKTRQVQLWYHRWF